MYRFRLETEYLRIWTLRQYLDLSQYSGEGVGWGGVGWGQGVEQERRPPEAGMDSSLG